MLLHERPPVLGALAVVTPGQGQRGQEFLQGQVPEAELVAGDFCRPNGDAIAFIHTPEMISNFVFGGDKRNRLFMAGSTSRYSLYVDAVGARNG